jgi:hypothetical protein
MAARLATTSTDEKTELVRQFESLSDRNTALERALIAAYGENPEKVKIVRSELERANAELDRVSAALKEKFPEYAELVTTFLVSVDDLQRGNAEHGALLGEKEALLVYTQAKGALYAIVVTRKAVTFRRLDATSDMVQGLATDLRKGIDLEGVGNASALPVFNTARAYQLYQMVLAPFEPFLAGIQDLVIVPDWALETLPFQLLITTPPKSASKTDLSAYRDADWLSDRYALSTLPAVSSLRALRWNVKPSRAKDTFLGFGEGHVGPLQCRIWRSPDRRRESQ